MVEQTLPDREKQSIPPTAESAEGLHAYAHALLSEILEEQENAFAVAVAGEKMVGDGDIGARNLFRVISDINSDALVSSSLRDVIDQLARLAGSPLDRTAALEADLG